jgi:hypothetical protein
MRLIAYYQQRVFEQPRGERTEVVGWRSVLWAYLFGPLFFWKKRARLEATLLLLAMVPLLNIESSEHRYRIELYGNEYPVLVVWTAFAFLAPVLLVIGYRRKHWREIVLAR